MDFIASARTSIGRFTTFKMFIETTALVNSKEPSPLSGAVRNGKLAGLVKKFCFSFGCDSIIEIQPFAHKTQMLVQPPLWNRDRLSAKTVSLLFVRYGDAVSG